MVSYVEQVRACQKAFIVQVAQWSLDVEWMYTSQPDESWISGDMCVWCWLVDVQNLLWI